MCSFPFSSPISLFALPPPFPSRPLFRPLFSATARGVTTAEKLRGTKVWVPKAGLGVGYWKGSPHPVVRVRRYHARRIFENSDAKSCILVTNCCEISCFLKTTAKKLGAGGGEGTKILLIPLNLKVGGPVSPGPYGCCAHAYSLSSNTY